MTKQKLISRDHLQFELQISDANIFTSNTRLYSELFDHLSF